MILVLLLTRTTRARTRPIAIAAIALSFLLTSGAWCPAFAQAVPAERVAVGFTVGSTAPSTTFTQNETFELYSETGTVTAAYTAAHSLSFDGGVTLRLWRGLGVVVAGSHFRDSGTAQVSASVPNPLVFNQPRQIGGPASLTHAEDVVHVDAAYWIQVAPKLSVIVSGGLVVLSRQPGLCDRRDVHRRHFRIRRPHTKARTRRASTGRRRDSTPAARSATACSTPSASSAPFAIRVRT